MAVTNLLKAQVDQPVFEWMRFAPNATSATTALAASDDLSARYMYLLNGSIFYRYDTYSDSYQELCGPPVTPSGLLALKYSKYSGYRGHTISATSSTITLAGFSKHAHIPDDLKIRIIAGTGAGQERTITQVADAVIADSGVLTAVSSNISLTDNTKKWKVNQYDGYQCRIVYGTGQSQLRRILYNDTTTLYFSDTNHQAIDSFSNTGWSNISPFALPVSTAGSQGHYVIETATCTIDTPWSVTPDQSSIYMIVSGGIWMMTTAGASPFTGWYFYDILSDSWQAKTNIGAHLLTSIGTDISIDRTGEVGSAFVSGVTASSATARTLVNSGATLETDRYANYQLRITAGTGVGQRRRIVGHNATTFYVEKDWDVTPDSTSGYSIYGDTDKIWFSGNASSCLFGYSVEGDIWSNGHISDYGIARNISATPISGNTAYGPPHQGFGVTSITRTTSGIVSGAINAAGTNYVVGDLVTCSTTGTNGQFWVTGVTGGGVVTSIELAASGSGYSNGSSNTTGGAGSGLTITLTVGTTALVTTALNHDFKTGDSCKIGGCATDTSFNATFAIIGIGSLTTFSIAAPGSSASPTASNSQSTTLVVDAEKNWQTNEHTGKLLIVQTAGTSPTVQVRRITSNTANTITVPTITALTNGTGRYAIQEIRGYGAMCSDKVANRSPTGYATSGTATTLVDTTKNWKNSQWVNCKVRIVSGTGAGNESTITFSTPTTLSVASWGVATPDSTSKYEILDTYGVVTTGGSAVTTITDANKAWVTNILAGKRVRIVAGTGIGTELAITSNTATVITCASTLTTDTTSVYEIYEIPARSTGTNITWLFGLTDPAKKGRWLISPRGGASNVMDIYDIPTNTWEITPFLSPQTLTLTTGSMYSYDEMDGYYFTKDATGRIYKMDLNTFKVDACATTPYAQGTAVIGNRMEIVETADGLKYLYIMRHSAQEMWRTLVFW